MRQVRGSRAVRAALGGVAVAALVVVAGCTAGSSGQASTLPPVSSASVTVLPSGTASPAEWAPPLLPVPTPSPEVTERTVHGAEAAAASYFAALDYAFATGDTSPLTAMSTPECLSCAGQVEEIERVYSGGGYFSTRTTTVNASISTSILIQDPTIVVVAYHATPMIAFRSVAVPTATYASNDEASLQFEMKFLKGRWAVAGYTFLPGDAR